jgi:hypothetical protein
MVLMVGTLAPALGAQGTVPGVIIERRGANNGVRISGAPFNPAGVTTSWYAGERWRTDGLPENSPDGKRDAYSIRRLNDRMSYMVLPSVRTIRVTNADSVDAVFRAEGIERKETRGDVTRLGSGGRVLGHATERYRVVTQRESTTGRPPRSQRLEETTTLWIALDRSDPVIDAAIRAKAVPPAKYMPQGVILRWVAVTRRAEGGPSAEGSSEVIRLERASIDTMRFALPEGYRRVTQAEQMRGRRAHLDSLFAAQRARDRTAEAHQRAWLDSNGVSMTPVIRKP